MSKNWLLLAVFIFLAAVFFRFYQLGAVPVSLYWDETAILLDAKTLATTGKDMHGNGWLRTMFPSYGDYKLPVYIWLAAVSVKLFGVTDWALRLPSALAGLGSVGMAGLLGYELAKVALVKKVTRGSQTALVTGFVTAAVMAITPWSILFSRTGFEGHLGQFWLALSAYFTLKAVANKKLLVLSVLFGGLATYTYFSVRFVWPVVLVLLWLLGHQNQLPKVAPLLPWIKKNGGIFIWLGLALAGYLMVLQPMFNSPLYSASNQFRLSTTSILNSHDYALESNILREQAGNSVIDRVIFHRHWLMIRELLKNYADNLDLNFLFMTGDPNLRHGTGKHGLFLLPMLPLLVLGIYTLARRSLSTLVTLLVWWLVALLPASIPETTPHALRSLNALMPSVLVIGFGGGSLVHWLTVWWQSKRLHQRLLSWGVAAGVIASLALASLGFGYHYFTIYPAQSAYDWQDGYRQLTQVILERQDSVRTVWVSPAEDRFYLWLLAYGPYTAEQIQALPKEGYKVTQVDKVIFKGFEWERLANLDHQALVVGQPHDIQDRLVTSPISPAEEVRVLGDDEVTERYKAVLFKPNL